MCVLVLVGQSRWEGLIDLFDKCLAFCGTNYVSTQLLSCPCSHTSGVNYMSKMSKCM